jgi:hypothetical protein
MKMMTKENKHMKYLSLSIFPALIINIQSQAMGVYGANTINITDNIVNINNINKVESSKKNYPTLKGPYMGQTPPGETAEVFAPGIISTKKWELEGVFAPGMQEFYYTSFNEETGRPIITGFRYEEDMWHKFTELPRTGEPFITSNGQTMHLADEYRERTGDGWSDLKGLGPMFERKDWGIMRLTASDKKTFVFDDYKGGDVLRISRTTDGNHTTPEKLPPHINTGKFTAHPFIAPDESYLIWDSEREGGYGSTDLYISFRQTDGSWWHAINMGPEVNSEKEEFYGTVTPDNQFLMFNRTVSGSVNNITSFNVDIYWVQASIIERLRKAHQNNF